MPSDARPPGDDSGGTRARILQVALDLFSTQGYAATSIRHIAREVGVRESALYSHFKSKQEILETLFETYGPSRARAVLATLTLEALRADPVACFTLLLEQVIEAWSQPEEVKIFRLSLMENLSSNSVLCDAANSSVEAIKQRMREIFSSLAAAHVLPEAPPEFLTREFMGPIFLMRQEHAMGHIAGDVCAVMRDFARDHVRYFFRDHLARIDAGAGGSTGEGSAPA